MNLYSEFGWDRFIKGNQLCEKPGFTNPARLIDGININPIQKHITKVSQIP